jgi:hypothetical protein
MQNTVSERRIASVATDEHRLSPGKISRPPMIAKCIVCFEKKAWRKGVVCEHTELAYKEHWICDVCFIRYCQTQLRFPFKCLQPQCTIQYSEYEIFHITIPEQISIRWTKNALNEMKLEEKDNIWNCPSCNNVYFLNQDFKQSTVRCGYGTMTGGCNKVFCRLCQEPAHWNVSCQDAKERKEALIKDDLVLQQVKSQVKLLKCPQPSCVSQPALFRGRNCNRVKCPFCNTTVCGNCSEIVTSNHFCDDPDKCTRKDCKHCPAFPNTVQDLDFLECGTQDTCASMNQTAINLPVSTFSTIQTNTTNTTDTTNTTNSGKYENEKEDKEENEDEEDEEENEEDEEEDGEEDGEENTNDNKDKGQTKSGNNIPTNRREVPDYVSDADYAVMISIMTPSELEYLKRGFL